MVRELFKKKQLSKNFKKGKKKINVNLNLIANPLKYKM